MHYQQISELAEAIQSGRITPLEITRHVLERIRRLDPELESYSMVLADEAIDDAQVLTHELAQGNSRGPLHGVPVAVKDLFWVRGTSPSAGTIVFDDVVAPHDGTAVRRLKEAGAVILGKLRMSEGAFAAHHPSLPTPKNPWGSELWVGASSSGSAAATASGLCFASLGTDTGGSIRFPSAATGLTGLKPSWGRVSRAGAVEFAGSLDHVGPMARSVLDCALIYDAIAGPDPDDVTTLPHPPASLAAACGAGLPQGLRIGIDPNFMAVCDEQTHHVLDRARQSFRDLGAEIVEVELPSVDAIVDDWTPQCAVETALVHQETYRARPLDYGPQMRELIAHGLTMSAVEFQQILVRRREFTARFRSVLAQVDAVLLQVTGTAAPSASYLDRIGVGEIWRTAIMKATCPIDAAGVPSLTMPGGQTDEGAPIGFQLIAQYGDEATLARIGHAFQQTTAHHLAHPPTYA